MSHADFVHLRVHTAYSLSEGAIRVSDLAKLCQKYRMPAVAMTDTSNLFGALEFSQYMKKAGVQPIIGCQIALSREGEANRQGRRPEPDQLVLLAQNETGYHNLLKLSSKAFLETDAGDTPQVDLADLEKYREGLICLTGGAMGPVGRLLGEGQGPAAEALIKRLAQIYEAALYVELQRHNLPIEQKVEPGLLDLAYALDLPLVATNECFFSDGAMYEAHDALLCIAGSTYVGQSDRRRLTPEHSFKSAEEMRILFRDLPEAVDNTLVVAQRCAIDSPSRKPILPNFTSGEGRDEAGELKAQAREGLESRLQSVVFTDDMDEAAREEKAGPYRERLEFELDIITQMGFPGYFLIVSDFIKWAKAHQIPVGPGRGSGAGSVVAWALTITDLDPLRFGLLFERFLNPERVSMPDFDIDFCQDRRDEVIRYVQEKYGHDQVAQIITFGKLQARAALRDVGRVLEMPFGQVDRICKMVPNNPANPVTLAEAINIEPRLREEQRREESVARMIEVALKLEGLYRHASTHAAGVVIGDRALDELIPLYRDPRSDMPVTQFSMKYAEQAGLVKFDFLGLKTLTVLDRARQLLEQRGIHIDFSAIPLDDPASYELLGKGETVGVFQLESSGMRDVLKQMKPDTFEDIIALVALYRPGPMDNIPKYIACKHGEEEPDYLHEWLQPVLEETYGVIIYQEQVMEIAKILGGYSLGDADLLRRAMGKKIKEEMDAQRERFVAGADAKGVDKKHANDIFDLVAKFAGYGFNKSHAAAYALVAYHTAYLKANYPVEFMAAIMSLDLNNTDKLNVFRQEVGRMGIDLRQPDINRSGVEFTVEFDDGPDGEGAIRYALAAVKNVGREAIRSIVEERRGNGKYASLFDFAGRLDPTHLNKRQLENLTRAGGFDCLNENRAQVLASAETLMRHAQSAASERGSGQESLFGGGAEAPVPALPVVARWTSMEMLKQEFDAIGFYLSAHPLDAYEKVLERAGAVPYASLIRNLGASNKTVRLGGTVLAKQERRSAKGNPFAFVSLSDPTGMYEMAVFSELLDQFRDMLEPGQSLVLTVEARLDGDQPRITAQGIQQIDQVASQTAAGVRVFLGDEKPLPGLAKVLADGGRGKGRVSLILRMEGDVREVEMDLPGGYAISPQVRQALKYVPGVIDVHDI